MARKEDNRPLAKVISLDDYRRRRGLQPRGTPFREVFSRKQTEKQKQREERKKHNDKVLKKFGIVPKMSDL